MSTIKPQDRPTFKVAHLYRCQKIISRECFLEFQRANEEIVNTIVNSKDEDLWKFVRSLFVFDDYADCVPINAANLAPTFQPVQLFMNSLALDWNRDISIQKRKQPFVYVIQAARALIADQLNVDRDEIAFIRSGSDANAVINNGLDFHEKGRNQVVVWNENHPTMSDVAWKIRKERFPHLNIVVVDLGDGKLDEEKIVEKFLENVDEKTRLVSFSEVSHLSGIHMPAKLLCHRIHDKDPQVHVHLDGAQSWGCLKHDLRDIDCDSYSGGSHKWFLGPKETGILYMKKSCVPNFWPKDIGYDGEMEPPPTLPGEELPADASRFELVGQRNDTNLMGLLYTADLMGLIGFGMIEHRVKDLAARLRAGLQSLLSEMGEPALFEIETPPHKHLHHAILTIKFRDDIKIGRDGTVKRRRAAKSAKLDEKSAINEVLYDKLYEDYKIGVSTKKGNRIRFSPHIYNTEDHMDRAVQALKVELIKITK